ncbi:hypothetical protein PV327_005120 [Microctonus hyperodae]|uniref:Uncharacterized protein n=1 Tax=Microctonus hyperodae TaxID=165561 RepID=A0AA39G0R9_MICHY|nr:hypothetical protein PV327_005120 [Microctonus hyperodae]
MLNTEKIKKNEQTNQNATIETETNNFKSSTTPTEYINDSQKIKQLIAIAQNLNPSESDIKNFIKRTTRSNSSKRKYKITPKLNKRGRKDTDHQISSASEMDTEDETNANIIKY